MYIMYQIISIHFLIQIKIKADSIQMMGEIQVRVITSESRIYLVYIILLI